VRLTWHCERHTRVAVEPRHAQPGDPCAAAFVVEVARCWRMVHDYKAQATYCAEPTTFTGHWYSPRDDGTYWRVWSRAVHLDGLTGRREFGHSH
jgi:hypothetical protein